MQRTDTGVNDDLSHHRSTLAGVKAAQVLESMSGLAHNA